jgi:hypothetical protein
MVAAQGSTGDGVGIEFGLGDLTAKADGKGSDIIGLAAHREVTQGRNFGGWRTVVGLAVGHKEGVASASFVGCKGDVLLPINGRVLKGFPHPCGACHGGGGEFLFDGGDAVVRDGDAQASFKGVEHQAKADIAREIVEDFFDGIAPSLVVVDGARVTQQQQNIGFVSRVAVGGLLSEGALRGCGD